MRHKIPEAACPHCGMDTVTASCPEDPQLKPEVDDIGICEGCGGILLFSENLTLQKPTADQLAALNAEEIQWIEMARKLIKQK